MWAVFVGDEGHRFVKRTNADYIRAVEVMFLRRHLGLAEQRIRSAAKEGIGQPREGK